MTPEEWEAYLRDAMENGLLGTAEKVDESLSVYDGGTDGSGFDRQLAAGADAGSLNTYDRGDAAVGGSLGGDDGALQPKSTGTLSTDTPNLGITDPALLAAITGTTYDFTKGGTYGLPGPDEQPDNLTTGTGTDARAATDRVTLDDVETGLINTGGYANLMSDRYLANLDTTNTRDYDVDATNTRGGLGDDGTNTGDQTRVDTEEESEEALQNSWANQDDDGDGILNGVDPTPYGDQGHGGGGEESVDVVVDATGEGNEENTGEGGGGTERTDDTDFARDPWTPWDDDGGDDRDTARMIEDWIRQQFGGVRDTAGEEALIRELLGDRLGQSLVDQRARMGRMGMVASGASGAIEGDIRRQAAQDIQGAIFGVQADARAEELARASAAGNLGLGLQRNELDAAKEDFYNKIIAQMAQGGDGDDGLPEGGIDPPDNVYGSDEDWIASEQERYRIARELGFEDAADMAANKDQFITITDPGQTTGLEEVASGTFGNNTVTFYRHPTTGQLYIMGTS